MIKLQRKIFRLGMMSSFQIQLNSYEGNYLD